MNISVAKRLSLVPGKQLAFFITVSSNIGAQFWLSTTDLSTLQNFNEPIELDPGDYTVELIPTDDGSTTNDTITVTIPTDPDDPVVVDGNPVDDDNTIEIYYTPNSTALLTITVVLPDTEDTGFGFILNGVTYYSSITINLLPGTYEVIFLKVDGYIEPGYIDASTTDPITINLAHDRELIFTYSVDTPLGVIRYLAVTSKGVIGSEDGYSWRYVKNLISLLDPADQLEQLQSVYSNGKDFAIAISDKHAFGTSDGKTFTLLTLPAEDPAQPYGFKNVYYRWGYWFISGGYKLLRSNDNGATWQSFVHPFGTSGSMTYPVFYIDYLGDMYAYTPTGRKYKSVNLGETWTYLGTPIAVINMTGKEDTFGKALVLSRTITTTSQVPVYSYDVPAYYQWDDWNDPAIYDTWTTKPKTATTTSYPGIVGDLTISAKFIASMCFNDELCVGVGSQGQIVTSKLGSLNSWTLTRQYVKNSPLVMEGNNRPFYCCNYGNGLFIAGGANNFLAVSQDGYSWQDIAAQSLPTANILAITSLNPSYTENPYVAEVSISFIDETIVESDGSFVVNLTRVNIRPEFSLGKLVVPYRTGVPLNEGSYTAHPGRDYRSVKSAVVFNAGDSSQKTIVVPVYKDQLREGGEYVGFFFGDSKTKGLHTYRTLMRGSIHDDSVNGQMVSYLNYKLDATSYSAAVDGSIEVGVTRDTGDGYALFILALVATTGSVGSMLKDGGIVGLLAHGEKSKKFKLRTYARLYSTYQPKIVLLHMAGSCTGVDLPNQATVNYGAVGETPEFTAGDFSTLNVFGTIYGTATAATITPPADNLLTSRVYFDRLSTSPVRDIISARIIKSVAAEYNASNTTAGKSCTVTVGLMSLSPDPAVPNGLIAGTERTVIFPLGDAIREVSYYLSAAAIAYHRPNLKIINCTDCYAYEPASVQIAGSVGYGTPPGQDENEIYSLADDPFNPVLTSYGNEIGT